RLKCDFPTLRLLHLYEIRPRKDQRGVDLISDALESFLIARWRMIRPQSTRKAQMKTILMLTVGLILAGCGSTGNHVRNQGGASTPVQARGDWIGACAV